jgi:hypothetical protein
MTITARTWGPVPANHAAIALLLAGCFAAGSAPADDSPPPPGRLAADWGEIELARQGLLLHVAADRVSASGAVRIPRLNNPVAAVYLDGQRERALKLTPHLSEWEIALPRRPGRTERIVVVVETIGPPHIAARPRIVRPSPGGVVTLAAHDAVTHGRSLRYEPQPHKNTLGYWSQAEDWCAWYYAAPAGRYEVQILQGCGTGQGGSEVVLASGSHQIVFTVEETGHFQNFKNRTLGTIELAVGMGPADNVDLAEDAVHTLTLRPRSKKAAAVMDVRQVRLVPVKDKD